METGAQTQKPNLDQIMSRVGEIAAMPQVVYKIIELTGTTATAAHAIEEAISIDPGFSSKVLILANSAFYALPRRVTSIREAATFMGYKTIRQLAMTVGVFDMFVGKTDAGSMRRRTWWRHSVDTAVCAKTIGDEVPTVEPEDAYTCGLLHDVGKSLLDRYAEGNYERVEQFISAGVDTLIAERTVFGCTHAELGGAAASQWNLPAMIVEGVEQHHGPATGAFKEHVAITCLASEIAHEIVSGTKRETDNAENKEIEHVFSPWATDILKFDQQKVEKVFQHCKLAISDRSALSM